MIIRLYDSTHIDLIQRYEINGLTVQWFDGSTVRKINGSTVRWFDGKKNQWFNGSMV
ncbi:MAG: hypothetical protein LLG13_18580 [Bacteroidales bacterium]|nr:hypothetical protein [Bacteroidales bacterium]